MESIFIVFELSRRCHFKFVDLHSLRLDEAEQVLYLIFAEIKTNQNNSETHGRVKVTVIVGKGNHSLNGPVLLPYFKKNLPFFGCKVLNVEEGRIICLV